MKSTVPDPTPTRYSAKPPPAEAVRALEDDLRTKIDGEVRFDTGTRAIYSTDASNYRQLPIGVVVPRSVDDVVAAVTVAREHRVPVLSRGGGTSLAGQCCNVALVIDHSKYLRRILEFDREARIARVQAGTVLDDVKNRGLSGEPLLTFGPDPSTHDHCTIGGMIGNNSCGNHAIMSEFYGPGPRMEHNVRDMEVLTYDGLRLRVGPTSEDEVERIVAAGGRRGEIYARLRNLRDTYADLVRERFPDIPRRVSGYNLDALLPENGFDVGRALVGTEGTCVTVLEATLQMIPAFRTRSLMIAGFADVYAATATVPACREHRPIALEGWDDELIMDNKLLGTHVQELRQLPNGSGWIMAEFGGETAEEADAKGEALLRVLRKEPGFVDGRVIEKPELAAAIWSVRESGLGATAFVPGKPDALAGWEDSAVPPEKVSPYLRDLHDLFGKYGYTGSLYGHFGQGCVHCGINFDLVTAKGIDDWRHFLDEASDLVLKLRRLAVGRARRRSGPRRAPAEDVRPRAGPGVPRLQVDLGPGLDDEPGQGRRREPHRQRPQARHGLQPAGRSRRTSPIRRTAEASPTPRSGARGSASAGGLAAERCAPATW